MPIVIAHGVFGIWDELLPPLILLILIGLIGITWWNGRKVKPVEPPASTASPGNTEPARSDSQEADPAHYTVH